MLFFFNQLFYIELTLKYKSTLKSPTFNSCSTKTMSIPTDSFNSSGFSSLANQGVKTFASCFRMVRRSDVFQVYQVSCKCASRSFLIVNCHILDTKIITKM